MNNLAEKIKRAEPMLEYGVIERRMGAGFQALVSGRMVEAVSAASCLLRPSPGDLVLLCLDRSGTAYILSILERRNEDAAVSDLVFDGDVNVEIMRGNLHIRTGEDIALSSAKNISLSTHALGISAAEGDARISSLNFLGNFLNARIEKIKVLADSVDTIFRRAVQRLTSSFRYIEEHEEIQSASTRMLVEGTLTMQTKHTMHTAEGHIKIDAEQIHLG